jgi:hypothetical protein
MSHRMDSERMREGEEIQRRTGKPKGSPVRARQTKKDHWKAVFFVVVMDGIEPPTQGFSVLCSTI